MAERGSREANSILAASSRMGARNDGMRNICELLINVVMFNRPKVLVGLDQKVRGMDGTFRSCSTRTMIPPANRQALTHRVKLAEQGKPNYFHLSMESEPQGEPAGKWVKEVGESECRSVMEWIRVQICPITKVSKLPTGVGSRETSGGSNLYGEDR